MRELEWSLDSDELTEWAAYAQIDPFGGIRGDYHAAIITSNMMNAHAGKLVTKPKDFMPTFGPPTLTPAMSPQQIHAMLSMRFRRGPGG